jgi:hypothetical protein
MNTSLLVSRIGSPRVLLIEENTISITLDKLARHSSRNRSFPLQIQKPTFAAVSIATSRNTCSTSVSISSDNASIKLAATA